jgi:hypothetical protein
VGVTEQLTAGWVQIADTRVYLPPATA